VKRTKDYENPNELSRILKTQADEAHRLDYRQ